MAKMEQRATVVPVTPREARSVSQSAIPPRAVTTRPIQPNCRDITLAHASKRTGRYAIGVEKRKGWYSVPETIHQNRSKVRGSPQLIGGLAAARRGRYK